MDEWTLNDLLECSVCLERLDTSSKVLPCQHTFCKKCLEEILNTKKELRCPECRVLVEASIDELPPNVLLMRILEGMRNAAPRRKSGGPAGSGATATPLLQTQPPTLPSLTQITPQSTSHSPSSPATSSVASIKVPELLRPHPNLKQTPVPNLPCARAMYDYVSKEPGDLSFKKGDIIQLKKKVDNNWYHGECGGNHGVFPLCYVQVLIPPPSHVPQCKALYDFKMTNDEEGGCLSFNKGEVISVLRRVDENWAEGKLAERVGIFPLAFVEMNSVARALMKLSINSQPGPSRLAPPTPTSDDTSPLIPIDHNRSTQVQQAQSSVPALSPPQHPGSDSSSSICSTPNTSSSSTSPSSPASPPLRSLPPNLAPASPITALTSPQSRSSLSPRVSQEASQKRHSLNALLSLPTQTAVNRHSAELLGSTDPPLSDSLQETQPVDALIRHGSGRRHRRSGSSEVPLGTPPPPPPPQSGHHSVGSTVDMPAMYVALYPYKPQKDDELGLRKGLVYTVTERCQDGWYKGTCNRTQRSGVFPGNYVALAKSPAVQAMRSVRSGQSSQSSIASPNRNGCSNGSAEHRGAVSYTRERKPAFTAPTLTSFKGPSGAGWLLADISSASASNPPELPPRSLSPHTGSAWSSPPSDSRTHSSTSPPPSSSSSCVASGSSVSASSSAAPSASSTPVSTPVKSSSDKSKEKKSGVSLMRRLTIMKKSKSPPPPYSMDNPVFEDGIPSGAAPAVSTPAPSHFVHVRSGSCPSQLLQVGGDGPTTQMQHRLVPSGGSKRSKLVEPSSLIVANMTHFARPAEAVPSATHHRKSNSLDAGSADPNRKSKRQPIALSERFRCVVAYPPNSKYELELQVGDVIFVHDKREDGWYRGTQRRTGRTGLFPASFVEAV